LGRRYAADFSVSRSRGAYEIVEMIMAIVVFGSYAYTQTKHGHVMSR
jgi:hypothetical protein